MGMVGNLLRVSKQHLDPILRDPSLAPEFLFDGFQKDADAQHLCLDKAWHLVHFALTGEGLDSKNPLGIAVIGGTEIGDVDVGYGPAQYLTAEEAKAVAARLSQIDIGALRRAFNPKVAMEIGVYPGEVFAEDWEIIEPLVRDLRQFYSAAAEVGQFVVQWID